MTEFSEQMSQVLARGFAIRGGELYQVLSTHETTLRDFANSTLKQLFRKTVNSALSRLFSEKFKKDKSGEPQNWMNIEEKKIKEIFEQSKQECLEKLNQFRQINLPSNLTVVTPDADITEQSNLSDNFANRFMMDQFDKVQRQSVRRRTSSAQGSRCISEDEFTRVKSKFLEEIDQDYDEAI